MLTLSLTFRKALLLKVEVIQSGRVRDIDVKEQLREQSAVVNCKDAGSGLHLSRRRKLTVQDMQDNAEEIELCYTKSLQYLQDFHK
jgi:hypothetical protein